MFNIIIMTPRGIIYKGKAGSVFLCGDRGEFEILDYHAPIISILKEGDVTVDQKRHLPIKKGIVRFYENTCSIIAEE